MKVLLIDESRDMANTISLTLRILWAEAIFLSTESGIKAVEMVETEMPDMVILDVDLPDADGFEVLKQIRLFSDVPIIILTTRDAEMDKVRSLEMGADDYITKPFSPLYLLARIKAALRHAGASYTDEQDVPPFAMGDIAINFNTREVLCQNRPVHLTPIEYKLLNVLVRNEGRVVTHESLRQKVWGYSEYLDSSAVKKSVMQLRRKLGCCPGTRSIIVNERGIGYKLVKPR